MAAAPRSTLPVDPSLASLAVDLAKEAARCLGITARVSIRKASDPEVEGPPFALVTIHVAHGTPTKSVVELAGLVGRAWRDKGITFDDPLHLDITYSA